MTAGRDALRELLAEAVARHRDLIELVDAEGVPDGNGELFRYGCTCGHVRGVWTEREAIARLKQSWHDHVADALAVEAERFAAEQVAAALEPIVALVAAEEQFQAEQDCSEIVVAIPMKAGRDLIDQIFDLVAEAADAALPEDRDWDIFVSASSPATPQVPTHLLARAAAVLAAPDNDRRQG